MPVIVGSTTTNTNIANVSITTDQTQSLAYATSNRNSIRPSLLLDFARSQSVDNRITFTRASSATSFNNLGVLTTAATNVPRIDFDPATGICKGLLVEGASTNLLTYSNFAANWATAGSPTVSLNAATSPDGTTNATLWTRTTTASSYIGQGNSKAASALPYSFSVFVKPSVGNYVALRMQGTYPARADVVFNLSSGTISTAAAATSTFTGASASIQAISNGWYRVVLTATSDTNTSIQGYISFNSNGVVIDGTDSVSNSAGYIYGAQLEQQSWVSSLIATTGASASRAVDSAQLSVGSWYNANTGTLVAAFYNNQLNSNFTAFNWAIAGFYGSASDNNNCIDLFAGSGYGSVFRVRYNNVQQAYVIASGNPYQYQSNNKVAASWGTNGFYEMANGNSSYLGSGSVGTIPTVSYLDIGTRNTGGIVPGVTWIRIVVYYPQQLSNTEMQTLTTDY
jgi:hypothetical protein